MQLIIPTGFRNLKMTKSWKMNAEEIFGLIESKSCKIRVINAIRILITTCGTEIICKMNRYFSITRI